MERQSTFQLNPAFASATTFRRPLSATPRPSPIPALAITNHHALPRPPPMRHPTLQRLGAGPVTMPTCHSDHAPYFSGQVDDPIEDFLYEYEELANSCGLTERQKVEAIVRYIPYSFRDLWKSLDGYVSRDWTSFKLNLEEIYDGPSVPSRHSEQKLLDFVRDSSRYRMNSEGDVLQYYRDFLALSKPLVDSQRLSIHKRDKTFWSGFHPRDHTELYLRLIAKYPDQPSCTCFDFLDVYRMARVALSGNHILDLELDDSQPESFRTNRSEHTHERWLDQDERDPRRPDTNHKTYEWRHPPSPTRYTPQDTTYRRSDSQQVSFTCEAPPHLHHTLGNRPPSAQHIVQVVSTGPPEEESDSDNEDPFNFFKVSATERKKHKTHTSKLPKLQVSAPITSTSLPAPAPAAFATCMATTSAVLTRTTPQYTAQSTYSASMHEPVYLPPPREIDIRIGDRVAEPGVTDSGPQIIAIREDLAQEVGATVDSSRAPQMEGTNGATNRALSRAESLPTHAGDVTFNVHARVMEPLPSTYTKKEDSESDKEDPFLYVFAAGKKKHDSEIARTRLPKYHPSAPSTLASGIPSATVLAAATPDIPPSPATAVSAAPLAPTTIPMPHQTILINKLQVCHITPECEK
jgi:hypothetical protein